MLGNLLHCCCSPLHICATCSASTLHQSMPIGCTATFAHHVRYHCHRIPLCYLQCGKSASSYPWPAESIVDFFRGRTGTQADVIDRPSFIKSPFFPPFAMVMLAVLGWIGWKIYCSPLVRITALWGIFALTIYWFSASGGMYNIIRGMPMYTYTREGKLRWWMEVSNIRRCWHDCCSAGLCESKWSRL